MKVRIKPYILTICNNCSRCYDEIKCIKFVLEGTVQLNWRDKKNVQVDSRA